MFSRLIKRKDKKDRAQDEEVDEEKISGELSRPSLQREPSSESMRSEQQSAKAQKPQRQTSKLQKPPPQKLGAMTQPTNSRRDIASPKPEPVQPLQVQQRVISPPPARPAPSLNSLNAPRHLEEEPPYQSTYNESQGIRQVPTEIPLSDEPPPDDSFEYQFPPDSPTEAEQGVFSPIKDALGHSSSNTNSELTPEKERQVKQRVPLDDFDSSADEAESLPPMSPVKQPAPLNFIPPPQRTAPTIHQFQSGKEEEQQQQMDRRLPYATSALQAHPPVSTFQQDHQLSPPPPSQPPALDPDTSSASTTGDNADPVSPVSTSSASSALDQSSQPYSPHQQQHQHPTLRSSPSPISPLTHHPQAARHEPPTSKPTFASNTKSSNIDTTTGGSIAGPPSSTHSTVPTWSDASLRAYMEDESEVRDLLLIVHDKSDVKKVNGREHPLTKDIFAEEEQRLRDIERRLDGMLGNFWARRRRGGAVTTTATAVRS